jgi:multidrug efflux pump
MKFTDLFIRRPVLASVVSLLILVVGLRAIGALPVLQYPRTENAVVTVTTTYYGADPDVIAGFITTPLEQAIAQANGIDYMTSTSQSGVSTITVYLRLNYPRHCWWRSAPSSRPSASISAISATGTSYRARPPNRR